MIKSLLYGLCLTFFFLSFEDLKATTSPIYEASMLNSCSAPPPDSAKVSILANGDFMLTWIPKNSNDKFFIFTLKQNTNSGTWDTISKIQHVPGNSRIIPSAGRGWYKFGISTECTNGEHGVPVIIGPTGLILDLVLTGRLPVNPTIVEECTEISYENFNWVGFKVEYEGAGYSQLLNYFEFGFDEGVPVLKRPDNNSFIVAADFQSN